MQVNALPRYDMSVNTTGCCPKFDPEGWDGQDLRFDDKLFVHATTRSLAHVPINMGKVFARVGAAIEKAKAMDPTAYIVLSRDVSPWSADHFFAVARPVPGEEMTTLSGAFTTRVFEGPYAEARRWHEDMRRLAQARGGSGDDVYFFYTTCPKCAKAYGKNYVVGVARIA